MKKGIKFRASSVLHFTHPLLALLTALTPPRLLLTPCSSHPYSSVAALTAHSQPSSLTPLPLK